MRTELLLACLIMAGCGSEFESASERLSTTPLDGALQQDSTTENDAPSLSNPPDASVPDVGSDVANEAVPDVVAIEDAGSEDSMPVDAASDVLVIPGCTKLVYCTIQTDVNLNCQDPSDVKLLCKNDGFGGTPRPDENDPNSPYLQPYNCPLLSDGFSVCCNPELNAQCIQVGEPWE